MQCIICEEKPAVFCIKGMSDTCYCKECAEAQFSDIELLEKI